MIKILIVEDEIPARNSLKYDVYQILKDRVQIEVAADGLEALENAKTFCPDILLTDIRMPHMLGTQLAEKILKLYPQCKIIFLSGYSDKNFLKLAIKLGVIDYIEKPVDTEDLKIALEKAIRSITVTSTELSAPNDAILKDLFKNKQPDGVTLPENCKMVAAMVTPCNEYASPIQSLIRDAARKYELDILCRKRSTGAIEILFINLSGDIRQKLDSLFKWFFVHIGESENFKCAVGSIESSKESIYKSYQNAVVITDIAFFRPVNTVIYFDDININELREKKDDLNITANSIYNAVINGNLNRALHHTELLYNKLCNTTQIFSSGAKEIYYNLSKSIMEYYDKFFSVSNSENGLLYTRFSTSDSQTLSQLHEYLLILINLMETLPPVATESVVDLAIFYLEQHYTDPNLSISDIVRFCRINTSQLCTFFKNRTGYTINNYLTNMRINLAKKLLVESNHKIDDISDMCGFNYPKYFFRVFKKHTSLTPSEYRKKHQK